MPGSSCWRVPNVLAQAIERLHLSEAERVAFGHEGRERVLAHFTYGRVAQKTWLFWQEILDACSAVRR